MSVHAWVQAPVATQVSCARTHLCFIVQTTLYTQVRITMLQAGIHA